MAGDDLWSIGYHAGVCLPMPTDPWGEFTPGSPGDSPAWVQVLASAGDDPDRLTALVRESPSSLVRAVAHAALEAPPAVPRVPGAQLLDGLRSGDVATRLSCARSLGATRDERLLPALKSHFATESAGSVRQAVLHAVARLGETGQWPFLAGCWRDPDRSIRLQVLELAARLAPRQELVALVLEALRDQDPAIKDRAMGLLMIAGSARGPRQPLEGPAAEPEDLKLGPADKIALSRRLVQDRDLDLLPLVRGLLEDPEPAEVAVEALRAVAVLGGADEAERIRRSLTRAEPTVVAQALLSLSALGDRTECDRARALLTGQEEPALHAAALAYLTAAGESFERGPASLARYPLDGPLMRHVEGAVRAIRSGQGAAWALYEPAVPPRWTVDWKLAAAAAAGLGLLLAAGGALLR